MPNKTIHEIAQRHQQDIYTLASESLGFFTSLLAKGLCTLLAVKSGWRALTQEVGTAFRLEKPMCVRKFEEKPPVLTARDAPTVTVLESKDKRIPVGKKLTLFEANQLVAQLDAEYCEQRATPCPVKLQIDFVANGKADRYEIAPELGSGTGSILDHMRHSVDRYLKDAESFDALFENIPDQLREPMQNQFASFVVETASHVRDKLLPYFEMHCALSGMEQYQPTAFTGVPGVAEYMDKMREYAEDMRKTLNCSSLGTLDAERGEPLITSAWMETLADQKQECAPEYEPVYEPECEPEREHQPREEAKQARQSIHERIATIQGDSKKTDSRMLDSKNTPVWKGR